jgi:peptide/nickel transport system substrate-binding protein
MLKKLFFIMALLLALPLALAACQPQPEVREVTRVVTEVQTEVIEVEGTPQVVEREVTVVVTEREVTVVEATPVPAMPVDRRGAWLDTVVFVEEPSQDSAISRLLARDLDLFGSSMANPVIAARVADSPQLRSIRTFGLYDDLTPNPCGPEFDNGNLNPFADARAREALNWLIDRDYVAQELYGGLAVPRYLAISPAGSDYARMADVARAIEAQYAHDVDRAREAIAEVMEEIGAEMSGGQWQYNGAPVEIILLIRTEDTRRQIGDYVANQLEDIGFVTVREYRTAGEASAIWYSGDPCLGQFHIYTGGWSATAVSRDEGWIFAYMYTDMGLPSPLWGAYENDPAFYEVAERLDNNDFSTLEERRELFAEALELSMRDANKVWVTHRAGFTPMQAEISVAADLFGGVAGGGLWAATLRRGDEIGGSMRIALPSIMTEPWNPVAGSNWLFDAMLFRGIGELAVVTDPFTGLGLPNRIERAEVVVQEGLPVGQTLDWVTLEFASSIEVPDDAWADWDAVEQRWITVGELEPGRTALLKSTAYFPADLYDTVAWHDGSPISVGDFVMFMIVTFDRAKEESPNFDQARVAPFNSFMGAFKGMRIVSENPLIIEHYTDNYALDAENSVTTWWPYYAQGSGAWHNVAIGNFADAEGEAVWSQAKASNLEVDRLNYIAGETVAILRAQLDRVRENDNELPYAPTMSQFVSAEEAEMRYQNLAEWHRTRGHFWLGTGVFFLERGFPVEGTVILQRNPNHPDSADRWARFAAAPIAEVEVDGPTRVTIGSEAVFDVFVDFEGEPYAVDDILQVTFLVIDAEGEIAHVGEATPVADGEWQITLTPEITGQLAAGSNRLEAIVVSRRVAMPSFDAILFVTAP